MMLTAEWISRTLDFKDYGFKDPFQGSTVSNIYIFVNLYIFSTNL